MSRASARVIHHHDVSKNPSTGASVAISIEDLGFRTGSRGQEKNIEILRNINLEVHEREFIAIVGPSGCGKSTLLNFVAGLLPIQHGKIQIGHASRGGQVLGYMFQQHGLLPWRSVRKNVEIGLEVGGIPASERARTAIDMIEKMGLSGFENHYPREISGGMKQRVALARTLVTHPGIVLMDEPFSALDVQTRIAIQELFAGFWEQHKITVVLVTHDIDEALLMADSIVVMGTHPGRIIAKYEVNIERPRSHEKLRHSAGYQGLYDQIWQDIGGQSHIWMKRE